MDVDTIDLPAVGWGVGWLLAFIGVGAAARAVGSEQRRFAQSALGKYLPPDVANEIMRDPERLALHGEQTRDLRPVHRPRRLHQALPRDHAGDAVAAAQPLSRPDERHRPQAWRHARQVRRRRAGHLLGRADRPARRCRPRGPGRDARCTRPARSSAAAPATTCRRSAAPASACTAARRWSAISAARGASNTPLFGDAMNTAARLESANKALKTTMLVSDEAKRESSLDFFRPMGRIVLSGRATPVEVWEPVPDMDAGAPRRAERAVDALRRRRCRGARSARNPSPPPIRRMRLCNISSIGSARSVREVILSWGRNKLDASPLRVRRLARCHREPPRPPMCSSSARPGRPPRPIRPAGRCRDNARITLRAGDVVVVLAGGGTRTFRGPGTYSPGTAVQRRHPHGRRQ